MRLQLTAYEVRKAIDYKTEALRPAWHDAGGGGGEGVTARGGRVRGTGGERDVSDIEPTLFLIIELSYWLRLFLEKEGSRGWRGRERDGGREAGMLITGIPIILIIEKK